MIHVYFNGAIPLTVSSVSIGIDPALIPLGTSAILFAVNEGGINWLPEKQDPTRTFGFPLYAGQTELLEHNQLDAVRFISCTDTDALITVMFVSGINVRY